MAAAAAKAAAAAAAWFPPVTIDAIAEAVEGSMLEVMVEEPLLLATATLTCRQARNLNVQSGNCMLKTVFYSNRLLS